MIAPPSEGELKAALQRLHTADESEALLLLAQVADAEHKFVSGAIEYKKECEQIFNRIAKAAQDLVPAVSSRSPPPSAQKACSPAQSCNTGAHEQA